LPRLPPDRAAVVCGVDGCKTGWVVVWHELTSNRLWWDVVRTLPEIAAASPRTAVIAIDVPIGLLDAGARECDREARRRLGSPRSSSVFTAPLRPLLDAHDYAEASALRRRLEGKGLSRQAWGIVPKVREVDEALRADGELRQVVREVHPELCFAGMNGGRAMAARKKIAAGRTERVAVLRAQFGDVVDEALASKPSGCQADDLLDAFAAAWTAARVAHEQEEVIPTIVPRDDFGLPMEMAI
jgi:predicted RNase H-like nuclease